MDKITNKTIILAIAVGIGLFAAFSNIKETAVSINFDTSIAEDATADVLASIMNAREKSLKEIKFEKGTYHFYPDKGYETFCRISNHDDVLVHTAFPLYDFNDIVIDGQGSTFIFHGRMIPFIIEGGKNINIKNLSIDWAVPFHFEGKIVAKDNKAHTFDLAVSKEYPYEIRNGQLIFVKEYYEHTIGQSILYDPERKAIAFDTESYTPIGFTARSAIQHNIESIKYKYDIDTHVPNQTNIGRENRLKAEQIKPGLVRIYNHKKKLPPVGTILVGKGTKGQNRIAPAFRLQDVIDFRAENVNVHHAGGMGLIAENSENLILDNFNVTPSNGRMVSTTADATHFVGCRGKIELKNCTFNNQLDDATNVHGTYVKVLDILNENRIGVRIGHFQQQGFTIGRKDDVLGLVRLEESFFPYDQVTIKDIQKINGRYHIITLNEKIPVSVKVGDLLENQTAYPELLVENCNISGNRARGLLLSTPKKTVIKDNFFHTEMEAILIPVESSHWFESGNAANVFIKNNTFQDCQHSGFNRGVIRFVTDDDNENIAFKNIEITDNNFHQFDHLILEVSNTSGLKFTRNNITTSDTFKKLHPDNPAFRIKNSEEIILKNNKYKGSAKKILETDESLSNLEFN